MVESIAAAGGSQPRLLDPQIFDHLKARIEEDQQVRDELSQIVQRLDRANSLAQGLLSRIHGTPRSQCETRPFASRHPSSADAPTCHN